MKAKGVCVFDVNETLLRLDVLDEHFESVFGKSEYRQIWFRTALHTSAAITLTNSYVGFGEVLDATLGSTAEQAGVRISDSQKKVFKKTLEVLPAHSDVKDGLTRLKQEGFVLAALTNSSKKAATAVLKKAGIADLFKEILSTDSVKAFKPSPKAYEFAASKLGVEIEEMWLVAAHAWDTHGGSCAGARSALIKRAGHGLNECFHTPDIEGDDLLEVAAKIIQESAGRSLLRRGAKAIVKDVLRH